MFYKNTKLRYLQTNFNNDFHDSQVVPYHKLKSLRSILLLTPCISYLPLLFYYLKKVNTCKLRANKIINRVILDQLYTKQMSFHWWIVLLISTAGSKKWFKTQTLSKWCCLSQHSVKVIDCSASVQIASQTFLICFLAFRLWGEVVFERADMLIVPPTLRPLFVNKELVNSFVLTPHESFMLPHHSKIILNRIQISWNMKVPVLWYITLKAYC